MAKKRGGIAGFYDRNKGLLQKAVPAALSFVPGIGIPLAAGAGALMRGMDRPGESGIGFNAFQGLRGGVEGALTGATTQAVAGGVKGLLAPKAMSTGMGGGAGAAGQAGGYGGVGSLPGIGSGLGGAGATTEPITGFGRTAAERAFGDLGMSLGDVANAGKTAGRAMGFRQALMQPQVLAAGVQGGLSMLPSAQTAALEAQTKLAQEQFDEEKRRFEQQRQDRAAMARLLMPMYQDYMKQLGYSR